MTYFLLFTGTAFFVAVVWTIATAIIIKTKGTQNGTARMATVSDLHKNGLLAPDGIMCGMTEDAFVTYSKRKTAH